MESLSFFFVSSSYSLIINFIFSPGINSSTEAHSLAFSICCREKVTQVFTSSCLYYCNSLYFGITQPGLAHLQLVQNAAARVFTRKTKRKPLTSILAFLHRLPVSYRINFKILMLANKGLNDLAPSYIENSIHHITEEENSSEQRLLSVLRDSGLSVTNRVPSLLLPQST